MAKRRSLFNLKENEESVLKPNDIENLKRAFNKFDKKKSGSIKPNEMADVFRMAGQNPTQEEASKMNAEADEQGTGMIMFSDILPIAEKYWRSYDNCTEELREACLAFGNIGFSLSSLFFHILDIISHIYLFIFLLSDRNDMGIINYEDLKPILIKYGEMFDEDELELFEKSVNISDGKIIVDGNEYKKTKKQIIIRIK